MAELKLALGTVLDIASGKEIDDAVKKILGATKKPFPKYFKKIGAGTSAASGDFLMDVGGPVVGEIWDVRALAVIQVDPWTAGTGKAGVFIGQGFAGFAANGNLAPTNELEDAGQSVPYTQHYVEGQLWVLYPNHLYVVIHTPAASTAYAAIARLVQIPVHRDEIA